VLSGWSSCAFDTNLRYKPWSDILAYCSVIGNVGGRPPVKEQFAIMQKSYRIRTLLRCGSHRTPEDGNAYPI
jgi:hypothetical protein